MDATLLYLETPTSTSNIGIVCRFDGPIAFDRFVSDFKTKRLPRLPRFRHVIAPVPLNLGFPTWEADPAFDLCEHLHELVLEAPGNERLLSDAINHIMTRRIDLRRPPWEITLINGLADGGSVILIHMHHCITDGAGLPKIFDVMFDSERVSFQHGEDQAPNEVAGPLPGTWSRIAGVFRDRRMRRKASRRRALDLAPEAPSEIAERKAVEKQRLKDFGRILKEFMQTPGVRLPFNAPLSGRIHYGRVFFELVQVRRVADALRGTINDVMLTVLGGAIDRYAEGHGIDTQERFLRVYQAANTRRVEEHDDWGNRLAFMPALVPLGLEDANDRFNKTAAYTKETKALGVRETADRMVRLFQSASPPPLAKLGLRLMLARAFQRLGALSKRPPGFNIYLTNVKFPTPRLCLGERRMIEMSGLAPLVPNTGVTCTALSFNGRLAVSVSADRETMPDVEGFCRMLESSFDDCLRAALSNADAVEPNVSQG